MAFIQTVLPEEATEKLKELYQNDIKNFGYVPNFTMAMSLRPDVLAAWQNLLGLIRSKMTLRRYELVTIAAASALRATY